MVSILRPLFNIKLWYFIIIFYISVKFKGNLLFKSQNQFQRLKPKCAADQYTWGFRCEELKAESPFILIADTFTAFPAGNQFYNL